MVLQADIAEDHNAVADFDRVDDGYVFLYVPFPFKALLALEDGGRGEVDLGGELFCRQFRILLQLPQDKDVGFIQCFLIYSHFTEYYSIYSLISNKNRIFF